MKPRVWFFGVWSALRAGHFMHQPSGLTGRHCPFDPDTEMFDAAYTPDSPEQDQTLINLVVAKGCTVLAMWDRSVDSRYGSNAAFVAEGHHNEQQMWALALEHFPAQTQRLAAYAARRT